MRWWAMDGELQQGKQSVLEDGWVTQPRAAPGALPPFLWVSQSSAPRLSFPI